MQTVEGLDELDKSIDDMIRRMNGADLERATAAAGNEILKEVEIRAPVKTGELKASIGTFISSKENRAKSTIQVSQSKKGGIRFYAVMLEYGTSKMRPHPFMRPAFDAAQNKAVEAFTREIEKAMKG